MEEEEEEKEKEEKEGSDGEGREDTKIIVTETKTQIFIYQIQNGSISQKNTMNVIREIITFSSITVPSVHS